MQLREIQTEEKQESLNGIENDFNETEAQEDFEDNDLDDFNEPEGNKIDIDVTETTTPSGRPAIAFILPDSKKPVVLMKPRTIDMIEIEKAISKAIKKNGGNNIGFLHQTIILLSFVIVEFGGRKGMNCVGWNDLTNLEMDDIQAMNGLFLKFFPGVVGFTG